MCSHQAIVEHLLLRMRSELPCPRAALDTWITLHRRDRFRNLPWLRHRQRAALADADERRALGRRGHFLARGMRGRQRVDLRRAQAQVERIEQRRVGLTRFAAASNP